MNLKPILHYQLREYFKVFSAFYGVVYSLIIVTLLLKYTGPASNGSISGMEIATMVACFIVGLTLFKNTFRFLTSFGNSRRRLYCGLTAAIAITAVAVSLLDTVNAVVFSNFINYQNFYWSMATQGAPNGMFLFSYSLGSAGNFSVHLLPLPFLLKSWLWCFLSDFSLAMLGFLVAALYYRMSKPVKIIVSVGVPAFFFIFLPQLDLNVTHGAIGHFVTEAWTKWTLWGLTPGPDLLSRLAVAALFAGGTWLLLRRAELYC